jgi:acetyl-CoA synthetase
LNHNIAFHCTQKQVDDGLGDKTALRFIFPDLSSKDVTFAELNSQSNQFAILLTNLGFKENDVIFTFLPKCLEQFVAFLGTLKIRAIIGTLFSTFGEEALLDRLSDSKAKCIVTKKSLYKKIDRIKDKLPDLQVVFLIDIEEDISGTVLSYSYHMNQMPQDFEIPTTSPSTPSVLHYTSGSTGKPKGVLHHHKSLSTQIQTAKEILQLSQETIYWCTADQGWVTGTSYGIIAPLSLGVTSIHYTGGYDPKIWFKILEDQNVSIWYTAPTALRMLMREPDIFYQNYNLSKLNHIFSVGEPLNPEIYQWGKRVLNKEIYDTWFQTETGSIMIANRPGLPVKPGSMGVPVRGIQVGINENDGTNLPSNVRGNLCLQPPWDSMFIDYLYHSDIYKGKFKFGWYFTGDTAYQDTDGYFWFTGRSDDIINTSGHLLSPFEVESALLEIPEIAESGVISAPDDILFEKVVAFIALRSGLMFSPDLEVKIKVHISNRLASYAIPQEIKVLESIPKNKSGKIMRRVLKAIYLGTDPGDLSTMED